MGYLSIWNFNVMVILKLDVSFIRSIEEEYSALVYLLNLFAAFNHVGQVDL